ncbi:Disease resistance protein RGA2 [Senna tora]|uniref:Disease resistance protein RGA2 n=1 Tax=Senna tora TaxID=362788 RepID=A0A834X4V5_9FABA|nr:Disease resistance protein RGA2 [Senna tora]
MLRPDGEQDAEPNKLVTRQGKLYRTSSLSGQTEVLSSCSVTKTEKSFALAEKLEPWLETTEEVVGSSCFREIYGICCILCQSSPLPSLHLSSNIGQPLMYKRSSEVRFRPCNSFKLYPFSDLTTNKLNVLKPDSFPMFGGIWDNAEHPKIIRCLRFCKLVKPSGRERSLTQCINFKISNFRKLQIDVGMVSISKSCIAKYLKCIR